MQSPAFPLCAPAHIPLEQKSRSGSQSGGLAQGPLGAHKAASDSLSLATSMVKLQGQMGQLTIAVEGLRDEWEEAAEAIRGDREAIR